MATLAASGDRKTPDTHSLLAHSSLGTQDRSLHPSKPWFPHLESLTAVPGARGQRPPGEGEGGVLQLRHGFERDPHPAQRATTDHTDTRVGGHPCAERCRSVPGNTNRGETRRPGQSASGAPPRQRKQLRDQSTAALTAARRGAAPPSTDVGKRSVVRPQRPVTQP